MVDTSAVKRPREPAAIRLGLAISDWTERWFPDAFVFALLGIVVVFVAGLLRSEEHTSELQSQSNLVCRLLLEKKKKLRLLCTSSSHGTPRRSDVQPCSERPSSNSETRSEHAHSRISRIEDSCVCTRCDLVYCA